LAALAEKLTKDSLRDGGLSGSVGKIGFGSNTFCLKMFFLQHAAETRTAASVRKTTSIRRFCHSYNFQKRQETGCVDTSIHFWWMGVPFVDNKISLQRCRRLRMWMKWTEGVGGTEFTMGDPER